jgi:sensor histidine kinase YesM
LLAVYSYLNIQFTEGYKLFGAEVSGIYLFLSVLTIVFSVWEGNRILDGWISKFTGTYVARWHPLIKLFFASILNVLVVASIVSAFLFQLFSLSSYWIEWKLSLGFAFRVNLFLNSINAIVFFINQNKNTQLEAQELKKKNIEAQFEILRNQVNPHFLFNSLNVLSSLVHENPDLASDFIERLSKVYRYLLNNQNQKLIELKEEISFLQSYLFLLSVRYPDNLKTSVEIPADYLDKYLIPPATLQILIENVIKHNIVSVKKPLKIKISNNHGNYLTITNNLQEKINKEPSTSVGLSNIVERYKFLTQQEVIIEKNNNEFKVRVPLLDKKSLIESNLSMTSMSGSHCLTSFSSRSDAYFSSSMIKAFMRI